ncbi:MAG TPA: hypothetical protein VE960_00145 [bacterium]|nr:hypothetical protein [bacterium]
MKRFASILVASVVLLALAGTAMANIGWAGNIWPVNGTGYSSNDNIGVYVQVWKDGCTGDPGPCADISARLFYRCTGDPAFIVLPMPYFGQVGNNDEFSATIPNTHGCSEVEFYVEVIDAEDGEVLYPPDQAGNGPNFFLPITAATAQDVLVTFQLCIPEGSMGDVCVTGSDPAITNWGQPGVYMGQPCPTISPNLYEVEVLFLAGTNPTVQYKYQKDDCSAWDCDPNHYFMIDDSQPTQVLALDTWCWGTPDCPTCASPVEDASWGTVKALYR